MVIILAIAQNVNVMNLSLNNYDRKNLSMLMHTLNHNHI